jgi:hypothetical protein
MARRDAVSTLIPCVSQGCSGRYQRVKADGPRCPAELEAGR